MLRAVPPLLMRRPVDPFQAVTPFVVRPSRALHKLLIALLCIVAVGAQAPMVSPAPANAQEADEPRLVVPLHGSTLRYRTLPSAAISLTSATAGCSDSIT